MANSNDNNVITLAGLRYFYQQLQGVFCKVDTAERRYALLSGSSTQPFSSNEFQLYGQEGAAADDHIELTIPEDGRELLLEYCGARDSNDMSYTLRLHMPFSQEDATIATMTSISNATQNLAQKQSVTVSGIARSFVSTPLLCVFDGFTSGEDLTPSAYSIGQVLFNTLGSGRIFTTSGFFIVTGVSAGINGEVTSATKLASPIATQLYYCKSNGKFYIKSERTDTLTEININNGGGSINPPSGDYIPASEDDINSILANVIRSPYTFDDDDEGGDDNEGSDDNEGTGGEDNTGTENTGTENTGDDNNDDNNNTETT